MVHRPPNQAKEKAMRNPETYRAWAVMTIGDLDSFLFEEECWAGMAGCPLDNDDNIDGTDTELAMFVELLFWALPAGDLGHCRGPHGAHFHGPGHLQALSPCDCDEPLLTRFRNGPGCPPSLWQCMKCSGLQEVR